MDWMDISYPSKDEDTDLRVNDTEYSEIGFYEFVDVIQNIAGDGDVSYAIWCVEEDEVKVLMVDIDYKDGNITSYKEEITE